MEPQRRAIGLLSGGLDSILAARLLQDQGIEVVGYAFVTPFFGPEAALRARDTLGIRLEIREITVRYLEEVLKEPRYGYGRNLNPCIDCHAFMFRLAGDSMAQEAARFLFSGEVLGERPFSQNKTALRTVAHLSGYPDFIVRPLSARLLEETLPEKEGWVDRERLLDIQGRTRARQMELARAYGITDYPRPAGGCLLTEPNFTRRLRDLLRCVPDPTPRELELLKVGRHLRWDDRHKVVVGRRHEENCKLEQLWTPGDVRLWVAGIPGPLVLLAARPPVSPDALEFAARLAVRYSDAPKDRPVEVAHTDGGGQGTVWATSIADEEIRDRML
jgi:tRNA-uridine 2-sulfurtransferase